MALSLIPCSLRDARMFVARHHRHHEAPQGGRFAVAISDGSATVGVAIVGNCVARMLNDGATAEVTRLCVLEGVKNGCSMLYAACWRAARALGFKRLVTYTLPEEGGGSLRAAGWTLVGKAGGGSWDRDERPRTDKHPTQEKFRWEVTASPQTE